MSDCTHAGLTLAASWGWLPLVCPGIALLIAGVGAVLGRISKARRSEGMSPAERRRVKRGDGLGVEELARRLGRSCEDLLKFEPRYTPRSIPKRSGGVRVLHVPDAKTKGLQRAVLRRLLDGLKAHPAAHGFERGRSIVTNARSHVGQTLVVKVDVKDFFPTTRVGAVVRYFQVIGWDRKAANLLARLCCHEGGLPQGAPTSPRLSNLVSRRLDAMLAKYARRCRAVYTRYADDITFSCSWEGTSRPGTLARGLVQGIVRRLRAAGYEPNRSKIRIIRGHQQQRVTGLVVNQRVNLSRRTRRWLRAVEHRMTQFERGEVQGPAPTLSRQQLDGWKGLQRMIESQGTSPEEPGRGGAM